MRRGTLSVRKAIHTGCGMQLIITREPSWRPTKRFTRNLLFVFSEDSIMHHRLQNNSTRAGIGPWGVVCLLLTVLGCGTPGDEHQATPAPSEQSSSLALRAVFTKQAQAD